MKLKELHRKYILLGMIGFIIIGLMVAKVMAKNQDEYFLKNELLYDQVQRLYNEENFEEAAIYIEELLKNQPNSEVVNYMGGLISAINQDYNKAAILMQKALDTNPYRVEDPIFMLQLGEIFFKAERYEDAKTVLIRCQEWWWQPEEYPNYQERVQELLTAIKNQQ
ncbi:MULTISPECIES: tetratricopeptide repeat protein [unclassified Ureibacillus]|uniref:tetratricopeptide repeat protein n=1 Tax=unclassified Ureibacillus TaxID=2638520 RepID=UPI0030D915EF